MWVFLFIFSLYSIEPNIIYLIDNFILKEKLNLYNILNK